MTYIALDDVVSIDRVGFAVRPSRFAAAGAARSRLNRTGSRGVASRSAEKPAWIRAAARVGRHYAEVGARLLRLDLRPTEASVLVVIDSNPNISQSEIGRMLEIAGANMAPLVGRLEKRALIERQAVDGRSHGLQLTTAGRALTLRVRTVMNSHEEEVLTKIPVAHRAAFLATLHALWEVDE